MEILNVELPKTANFRSRGEAYDVIKKATGSCANLEINGFITTENPEGETSKLLYGEDSSKAINLVLLKVQRRWCVDCPAGNCSMNKTGQSPIDIDYSNSLGNNRERYDFRLRPRIDASSLEVTEQLKIAKCLQ